MDEDQQALSLNKAFDEMTSGSGIDCADCKIDYGSKQGVLLYVKASLSGGKADYILDYKTPQP